MSKLKMSTPTVVCNFVVQMTSYRKRTQQIRNLAISKKKRILKNIVKMNHLVAMLSANRINRNLWTLNRYSKFWEMEVPTYNDNLFKQHFRMSRQSFDKLIEKMQCLRRKDTSMRSAIPLQKRIAIAIYALASSSEYRTIAGLFGVGRTTVGEIVLEFCDTVYSNLKDEYINAYPPTQAKVTEIVKGFENLGFPQCYGAIDGSHIEICPPKEQAVDYYNYKSWYSIVLFAAADYKCRFTYINVGATGRNNDSYIFENSALKRIHENEIIFRQNSISIDGVDIPVMLIGDSAFKLSPLVMKPYPFDVRCNPHQKQFNYLLSKCRRVIENAFGQLKARFRKIGRGLEVKVENAHSIIQACCVLHNFLIDESDPVLPSWIDEIVDVSLTIPQPHFTNQDSTTLGILWQEN